MFWDSSDNIEKFTGFINPLQSKPGGGFYLDIWNCKKKYIYLALLLLAQAKALNTILRAVCSMSLVDQPMLAHVN